MVKHVNKAALVKANKAEAQNEAVKVHLVAPFADLSLANKVPKALLKPTKAIHKLKVKPPKPLIILPGELTLKKWWNSV